MEYLISKKIALLNQTTLDSLTDRDALSIIRRFTEIGLTILGADFGFTWWKTSDKTPYYLAYKSEGTPYEPRLPRKRGGNFEAKKTRTPFFVERVMARQYQNAFDVSPYMKSYVIIPISYKELMYGNIVICFTTRHIFSETDKQLAVSLGNTTAQSITIHRLLEKEHQHILSAVQQDTELKEERARTEFIANATHEIRTPLAIIRGNADIAMMNKKIPRAMHKAFTAITKEVEHLSAMITDLSLLTAPETVLPKDGAFEDINIKDVLKAVVKRCRTLAQKKNIDIHLDIQQNCIIRGNMSLLEKLFINLIKNAVTYGVVGGWIRIEASKEKKCVKVKVADNGIGIKKVDRARIFDRFYRVDASRSSQSGSQGDGTGLGLAIVQWIATGHGASVDVESLVGKGSTFTVTFTTLK